MYELTLNVHSLLSYKLYADDNKDEVVTLYLFQDAPPGAFYPGAVTWWVDLLRPYLRGTNIIACPSVLGNKAFGVGGPGGLGVALSHPELSAWASQWMPKLATLKNPVKRVPFLDSGLIGNPLERDPDRWVEVRNQQALYWRVPTNQGYYNDDPQRPVGRHLRRCNGGFADGHAESLKVSAIGLQFYPGRTGSGQSATGIRWLGGNGLFYERWLWSGNTNHWLKVWLRGTASNASAIGAKVRLRALIGGIQVWQLRQVESSFMTHDFALHFGLGNATVVNTLRIEWPSGIAEEFANVPVRRILTIVEPSLKGSMAEDGKTWR